MNNEDLARRAAEVLNSDPELARRSQEMRALLTHAQTVADLVNAYKVGCVPATAGPLQLRDTELAIYTASHMLMQLFISKANEGGDVAKLWVAAVLEECTNYAAQKLSEGR